MKSPFFSALILMFFYSTLVNANTSNVSLVNKIQLIVNQFHQEHGFNGSIALKLANQDFISHSVGYQKETVKLTDKHLFSSGSVGKEFTTVAILKLADEKKIQLNDVISLYIPNLPNWARSVTVSHLLSHTSGLPKINWKKNITTHDVMDQVRSIKQLKFKPGTQYLYGNINVVLRAKIVEEITGDTFSHYLIKHMISPLGMNNTIQATEINTIPLKVSGDFPTAVNGVTIYTTSLDLLRWELALLKGTAINGKPVTKFIQEHPLSLKPNHIEYDFGQFFQVNSKISELKHDGSHPSHHVLKYSNLTAHFSFVAMSSDGNKKTLYLLRDKIAKLVHSDGLLSNHVKSEKI